MNAKKPSWIIDEKTVSTGDGCFFFWVHVWVLVLFFLLLSFLLVWYSHSYFFSWYHHITAPWTIHQCSAHCLCMDFCFVASVLLGFFALSFTFLCVQNRIGKIHQKSTTMTTANSMEKLLYYQIMKYRMRYEHLEKNAQNREENMHAAWRER